MKFLQAIQKPMHIMGIRQINKMNKKSVNWRNMLIFISMCQFSTFGIIFFLIEANNLIEYSESSFISITALLFTNMFGLFIRNTANLFELIDEFEKITKKR